MNIHEYQAKAILRDYGATVAKGHPVLDPDHAREAVDELGGPVWVVKAQIHAGGRGKGTFRETDAGQKGGVRVTRDPEEAVQFVRQMLGRTLVTKQTGPAGKQVHRVYVEQGAAIAREFYLALLVDRTTSRIAFIASTEGGMDIEEVAASTPEKIVTFSVDPATGIQPFHGRKLARALKLEGEAVRQAGRLAGTL
jgi:succinyl-CoA synthetase beta subunit